MPGSRPGPGLLAPCNKRAINVRVGHLSHRAGGCRRRLPIREVFHRLLKPHCLMTKRSSGVQAARTAGGTRHPRVHFSKPAAGTQPQLRAEAEVLKMRLDGQASGNSRAAPGRCPRPPGIPFASWGAALSRDAGQALRMASPAAPGAPPHTALQPVRLNISIQFLTAQFSFKTSTPGGSVPPPRGGLLDGARRLPESEESLRGPGAQGDDPFRPAAADPLRKPGSNPAGHRHRV